MDYAFFQNYWWFLIALLGALLVFLLFVQGGQSLFFSLGKDLTERRLLVNSVGRKWEFTFTTLVVFGGAFFELRWCLLGMDAYSLLLYHTSRIV